MMNIAIRPLLPQDISLIVNYWLSASEDELKSMGADIRKLPSRTNFEEMLRAQLDKNIQERQSYAVIWLLDNQPVGHSNVNPFNYGESAAMHLHMWNKDHRKAGAGTLLVKASIEHFFEVLALKKIYSEPYAYNEAPNRVLKKAGFIFERKYKTIPGSINFEQEVNRWVIEAGNV